MAFRHLETSSRAQLLALGQMKHLLAKNQLPVKGKTQQTQITSALKPACVAKRLATVSCVQYRCLVHEAGTRNLQHLMRLLCWQVQEVWQHPERLDAAASTQRGLGGNSPFWLLNQTGVGVSLWLGPEDDTRGGSAPPGRLARFIACYPLLACGSCAH